MAGAYQVLEQTFCTVVKEGISSSRFNNDWGRLTMTIAFILSIPANDLALRNKIEQELSPYAVISEEPPAAFDLETIKLVIEVVADAVTIAANVVSILTFLRTLREDARKHSPPVGVSVSRVGEPPVKLEEANDKLLQKLLDLNPRGS